MFGLCQNYTLTQKDLLEGVMHKGERNFGGTCL